MNLGLVRCRNNAILGRASQTEVCFFEPPYYKPQDRSCAGSGSILRRPSAQNARVTTDCVEHCTADMF